MVIAAIGLGSNIGDPAKNIRHAIAQIALLGHTTAVSDLYHSKAWGYSDQPDFYNAALLIDVEMTPLELLQKLQNIELEMGRSPTFKWGPRLIDLDLLLFGNEKIDSIDLVLPHPFLYERAFVLKPLAQIDSSFSGALEQLPQDVADGVQPVRQ